MQDAHFSTLRFGSSPSGSTPILSALAQVPSGGTGLRGWNAARRSKSAIGGQENQPTLAGIPAEGERLSATEWNAGVFEGD
jgi:hypothetical protein